MKHYTTVAENASTPKLLFRLVLQESNSCFGLVWVFFVLHKLITQGKRFGKGRSFKTQLRTGPDIREMHGHQGFFSFPYCFIAKICKNINGSHFNPIKALPD